MARKLIYIDVNTFPNEGFTSGLFITVREILQRSPAFGFEPRLVTINYSPNNRTKIKSVMRDGLRIDYFYIPKNNEVDPIQTKQNLEIIFNEFRSGDVFICNIPAVFFDPLHLLVTQLLKERKFQVKIIFFDALFPKERAQQRRRSRNEYKKYLKNFDVYSVSKGIQRMAENLLKRHVKIFPNIYNVSLVKSLKEVSLRRYVTMINTHPIKGIDIFNAVAKKMPAVNFLIVDSWTDVPPYVQQSSNIRHQRFTRNVRDIYSMTKLLLVPSLCEEGPTRVITEAAINGIPVIANKIGSIPENGRMVQLVNPPEIRGYKTKGSVLFPVVNREDLEATVSSYEQAILRNLDKVFYEQKSRIVKTYAQKMIADSNKKFASIIRSW
jgi:glycosyltransferase involved in cell wall biosynthesis